MLWRRTCPRCRGQRLSDNLLWHIRNAHLQDNPRSYYSERNGSFESACKWYHMVLEDDLLGRSTADDLASWPDPLAREPSAGFKFLMSHHRELRPREALPGVPRDALDRFLEWGYCIWDRERLESWCLVQGEKHQVFPAFEWWAERTRRRPGE